MAGIPIPNDHNLTTDPHIFFVVSVPNSPAWKAVFAGTLLNLADEWRWDSATGDAVAAAEAGYQIFDSVSSEIDGGGP